MAFDSPQHSVYPLPAVCFGHHEYAMFELAAAEFPGVHVVTLARALELARSIAALPRAALRAAKRCIGLAPSASGYAAEIEETSRLHASDETRAAIAAFLHRSR